MKNLAAGLLAAGVVGACLVTGGQTSAAQSVTASKTFTSVKDLSGLDGIWRSQGYGRLVVIHRGRVQIYDETATVCVPSNAVLDVAALQGRIEISTDRATVKMPIDDPAYLHTFDRVDALPKTCGKKAASRPSAVLDALIDVFTRHYAFFKERDVEWPKLAEESREKLKTNATETGLLAVAGNLVARVDDAHVSLMAKSNGRDVAYESGPGKTLTALAAQAARLGISEDAMEQRWLYSYWERDVMDILLKGDGELEGNETIAYGLIGDNIGYIAIGAMEGLAEEGADAKREVQVVDQIMDDAMELLEDVDTVIVDISMNDGGYDTVARALAGRFAAKRTVGYYKYAADAKDQEPQAIYIEPSAGKRFTGPVYMITSDVTLSAAEIFTLSMRALPNVIHVGETTRGSLSDELSKPLPNGWWVNLSNEVYLDAKGKRWEGKGIPPQIDVPIFDAKDVTHGHLQAVQAVLARIRASG